MAIKDSILKDVQLTRDLALVTAFTALVFLSTSIFSIELPTTGYFNFGETFVYLAALIGGPIVGGIAGGFGSALADSFLGFGDFAPATLVLKGLEGFIVGTLFLFSRSVHQNKRRGVLVIISIFVLGFVSYLAITQQTFKFIYDKQAGSFFFSLPGYVLVIFTLVLIILIWIVEYRTKQQGKMVISCVLAGPIIVVGYFLYEIAFLQIAFETALIEIPFNILQVIFGTLIAVPIVSYLDELGILPGRDFDEEKT
ncbi:MAG: ECF transporter S component [Candidatus Hodarchaeales archaeon]|jgi:uncharacterized membrane protein